MPNSEILENSIKYDTLIGKMTGAAFDDATRMSTSASIEKMQTSHRTIIHSMLSSDSLTAEDKTFARLKADAMVLIGAGTETTARTLATAIYHILANKPVHDRVLEEIRTVVPTSDSAIPSTAAIRQLPYLTAVLSESLRIAHGVAGRLSRTAPDEDLQYGRYRIPRGVTFSQSMYHVHTDPVIFPNPHEFHPERFLGPEGAVAREHAYPFGKGTRNCLGINLAWSELYMTVAALIGGVKMELVETGLWDVTPVKVGLPPFARCLVYCLLTIDRNTLWGIYRRIARGLE